VVIGRAIHQTSAATTGARLGVLRSSLAKDQVHGGDYSGHRKEQYREAKQLPLPPRQFHSPSASEHPTPPAPLLQDALQLLSLL
jgi:hypothetical protein